MAADSPRHSTESQVEGTHASCCRCRSAATTAAAAARQRAAAPAEAPLRLLVRGAEPQVIPPAAHPQSETPMAQFRAADAMVLGSNFHTVKRASAPVLTPLLVSIHLVRAQLRGTKELAASLRSEPNSADRAPYSIFACAFDQLRYNSAICNAG